MENFENYFKLPLKGDEYASHIIYDSENNRAFDFKIKDKNIQTKLIHILNNPDVYGVKLKQNLIYDKGTIYIEGRPLLVIRSWGRLTGTGGGLGLDYETASNIQDEFANWIIKKLK